MPKKYLDENGDPVDPADLHQYEVVGDAPAPAPAPEPAARPAPAHESQRGGSGLKVATTAVLTAALVAGVGFAGIKTGAISLGAAPAAAPSASAAPTSETPSSTSSPTSSTSSSSPSSTVPSKASEPVQVANTRYTGAKWSTPPIKQPHARLRITDGVALPGSIRDLLDAPAAAAFDRFRPYARIAATAPDTLTVQVVTRSQRVQSWAEATVSTKDGKLQVTGETQGDNVDDSAELSDIDGNEADTDGGVYRVEGEGIPESAKGKRKGTVTVSTIKRNADANSGVVWIMVGDKLFRAVVEDMSGGSDGQDEEGK